MIKTIARKHLKPAMINFKKGHPNPSLLPHAEMSATLLSLCRGGDRLPLDYGDNLGCPDLRSTLAGFLTEETSHDDYTRCRIGTPETPAAVPVRPNRLFVTAGVSHGIDLLCATSTAPGETVWIERPTYFLAAEIFRSHGLVLHQLPMRSGGGVDVGKIVGGDGPPPKMIYLVPSHHNPTGYTMGVEDRAVLAEWAIRNGVMIVADEVYHLLDWGGGDKTGEGSRPARFAAFNPAVRSDDAGAAGIGSCVSVSALTKIFAPGVRTGWVEGPDDVVSALARHGYVESMGGFAPLGNKIAAEALRKGAVKRHRELLRDAYAGRAHLLHGALAGPLGPLAECGAHPPSGGYFMWIRFLHPALADAALLKEWCEEFYGVTFLPGGDCDPFLGADGGLSEVESLARGDPVGPAIKSSIRLCFAYLEEDNLVEGAKRLVSAVRALIEKKESEDGGQRRAPL